MIYGALLWMADKLNSDDGEHVATRTGGTGQEFLIAASLNGFAAAIDRLKALAGA